MVEAPKRGLSSSPSAAERVWETATKQSMEALRSPPHERRRCVAIAVAPALRLKEVERLLPHTQEGSSGGGKVHFYVHSERPLGAQSGEQSEVRTLQSRICIHPTRQVFIFPTGSIVCWNTSPQEDALLIEKLQV